MDPVSCRMRLESLLTIGLYIRQDAFQLWLRFLFRPVLFLYLYNVTPQTFALIQKYYELKDALDDETYTRIEPLLTTLLGLTSEVSFIEGFNAYKMIIQS